MAAAMGLSSELAFLHPVGRVRESNPKSRARVMGMARVAVFMMSVIASSVGVAGDYVGVRRFMVHRCAPDKIWLTTGWRGLQSPLDHSWTKRTAGYQAGQQRPTIWHPRDWCPTGPQRHGWPSGEREFARTMPWIER